MARFDELVAGTAIYRRWLARVEGSGFRVEERPLPQGTAAEIDRRTIAVDPEQFRYIDLVHESRHVKQLERAARQGYDVFAAGRFAKMQRAWLERGAYEYEQRLALRYAFADTYLEFIEHQIGYYWKRAYQQELRFSRAARSYFERLWR